MSATPGPWSVIELPSGSRLVGAWRVIEPGVIQPSSFTRRDSYGDTCYHGVQISEDDANLIAALPELLAIVSRFAEAMMIAGVSPVKGSDDQFEAMAFDAEEALFKATGRVVRDSLASLIAGNAAAPEGGA